MCANEQYFETQCSRNNFRSLLVKENGCLPGEQECYGFQSVFGGPRNGITCLPWDFYCALQDFFGQLGLDEERSKRPLLRRMPASTLSIQESDELDWFLNISFEDIWRMGINGTIEVDGQTIEYEMSN